MARVTTAGAASSIVYATTQTGATDVRAATSWQVRGATMWGGIALRASDANNLIFAGYRSGELAVYRVRNGTWTRLVGSAMTVGVGTTHQIEVAATGATIQVYWDGTLTLQTSDGFDETVDRHGLAWANGVDTASGYDSFRVSGTPAAPAPPTPPAAPAPPPPSSSGGPAAPSAPSVTAGSSDGSAPVPVVAPFGLISSVSDATVILQWSAPTAFPTASYILEVGSGRVCRSDLQRHRIPRGQLCRLAGGARRVFRPGARAQRRRRGQRCFERNHGHGGQSGCVVHAVAGRVESLGHR